MHDSPFSVQPIDRLGRITIGQEDEALEDTVGHVLRDQEEADYLGTSITKRRWQVAGGALVVLFGVLLARSAQLQVVQGNTYFAQAEGNRLRETVLPADRGRITDRSGEVLAYNVPAFQLWMQREVLETEEQYTAVVDTLASLTGTSVHVIHDLLLNDEGVGEELLVTTDMPREQALHVMASPEVYPWLRVEAGKRRAYAQDEALSLLALLGYTGRMNEEEYGTYKEQGYLQNELIGKTGIEQSYEQLLRGFPGEQRVEVDALGRPQSVLEQRDAVDGAALTLHVDAGLQAYIDTQLAEVMERTGAQNASVIVMDPSDGAIRALVSYPGYDTNTFTGSIDPDAYRALLEDPARPLFTRAWSGTFPSGSTFKPIVAAAALDADVIDEHTSVVSSGGIRIGQFYFPDWKAGGHGVVDVRKAIAESVNTFFYMIGGGFREFEGLGLGAMMDVARKFGLGESLGLDVPHEASGFLPSVSWKNEVKGEPWYIGDTYHVAIGQGDILVTPLQVAAFTAVFANGGKLYEPHVVDSYTVQGVEQSVTPRVLNEQAASPEAIEIVRQGLRETVVSGSGRRLSSLPVAVAGKTGTAQWHSEKENHAWFTGFAPYEDPEIVVTVLVEQGGEGSAVAVPLAYDIVNWWFENN